MNRAAVFILALAIALSYDIASAKDSKFIGSWSCNESCSVEIVDFDGEIKAEFVFANSRTAGDGKINSADTLMSFEGRNSDGTPVSRIVRLVNGGTVLEFTSMSGYKNSCTKK